jgi:AbrB family looped-hinge helix DNA binding protein
METTRLSSKGQVIVPKAVREARNWLPGTEFLVEEVEEGILLRPLKPFKPTTLEDVIGCTGYSGPVRSLEDMERAVAQGAKERHARGRY